MESYLPQVEKYLAGVREVREQEPKSIFYTKMYDEQRFYENTSGLDAEALCKAYAECDKPFVEMGQYGKPISEADYAYIQQGDKLSFSLEFDADKDEIIISDGEHFETKGLTETLFPQKTEPETEVTITDLIREGMEQGICQTDYPEEAAEMTFLYTNTVFDDLMEHGEEEKQRKIAAFIYNLERLLNMEQDSMKAAVIPIFQNSNK